MAPRRAIGDEASRCARRGPDALIVIAGGRFSSGARDGSTSVGRGARVERGLRRRGARAEVRRRLAMLGLEAGWARRGAGRRGGPGTWRQVVRFMRLGVAFRVGAATASGAAARVVVVEVVCAATGLFVCFSRFAASGSVRPLVSRTRFPLRLSALQVAALVSNPRHSVRTRRRGGFRVSVNRSLLRSLCCQNSRPRGVAHFWACALPASVSRAAAADAADAADAPQKNVPPVCCCLPGRKPDYLQASETPHLLEHHQVQNSRRPPTATSPRGTGPRPWTVTVEATLIPRWPSSQSRKLILPRRCSTPSRNCFTR